MQIILQFLYRGHRGRDRMIVGITTANTISAYHHTSCESGSGELYSIQHYVIKFISDLRQVGGFFPSTAISSNNKTDRHDIAEILLTHFYVSEPTESLLFLLHAAFLEGKQQISIL